MSDFRRDADLIDKTSKKYGGANGAYFCLLTNGDKRQISAGGNLGFIGLLISEAIAGLIMKVPQADPDGFLDAIRDTTMSMLDDIKNGRHLQ